MQSDDLKPAQFEQIERSLFRGINYLLRLKQRMEVNGFHPHDPMYRKVKAAYDAAIELNVHVHYRACGVPSDSGAKPVQTTRRMYPGSNEPNPIGAG
jgi:hypothetical protein